MATDALVFLDGGHPRGAAGTHVFIVAVGLYEHGEGDNAGVVGGDLAQLSSPPHSARALADWFVRSFQNQAKPLHSVSLLISEPSPSTYSPPSRSGNTAPWVATGNQFTPPPATLQHVEDAAGEWEDRLRSSPDNMAVFCFCGHGASLGHKASLLLQDFGKPGNEYKAAVDVDTLVGTMKNSPAIQQLYLLDCCRTDASDAYANETSLGSRIVSAPAIQRGHNVPEQQFVLFPTLDGEGAFGIEDKLSVFTESFIDAVDVAAADRRTGVWRVKTAQILSEVSQLVAMRVPKRLRNRVVPNAANATPFNFSEIDPPTKARSFVYLEDPAFWGKATLECIDPATNAQVAFLNTSSEPDASCWKLDLNEGSWRFGGAIDEPPPDIEAKTQFVPLPVAYVDLPVKP